LTGSQAETRTWHWHSTPLPWKAVSFGEISRIDDPARAATSKVGTCNGGFPGQASVLAK